MVAVCGTAQHLWNEREDLCHNMGLLLSKRCKHEHSDAVQIAPAPRK